MTGKPGRPHLGERAKHTLRLPIELDEALRLRAEQHNRSLNDPRPRSPQRDLNRKCRRRCSANPRRPRKRQQHPTVSINA